MKEAAGTSGMMRKLVPLFTTILILAAGLLVPAWLFPGYIECRGYTEPANWAALYAPGSGAVAEGILTDREYVERGENLLVLDDTWIRHNLRRIDGRLDFLVAEKQYFEDRLELFTSHREVEVGELHRLRETDRLLEQSSSVSRNQRLRSEYLYRSFVAAALREEADFRHSLNQNRDRTKELELERDLWTVRLDRCFLAAPVSGIFFSSESVFTPEGAAFIPAPGPGRRLEEGDLLGYIVPDENIEVYVRIPENRAGECRPGQRVLLIPDSRSRGDRTLVEGRLLSISSMAAGGSVEAVVRIDAFDIDFICGGLSARIDTRERNSTGFIAGLWESWVFLVNPAW